MEPFAGSDRFVVERTLGRGGYGVVYQVFDRARNARAALKTFHTLDAAAVYRLKQEFRTLADLSHPNLAALYELFSDGQQWFFTMELVDGTGFVSYVRGQPQVDRDSTPPSTEPVDDDQPTATTAAVAVPEAPVAPIAPDRVEPLRRCLRELATGLGYLHGQGLLHHDVKSSNVLVTRDGRVVLLDFGLVAEIGRRSGSEDGLHGTLAYISPEQIGREPVTAASDWYSVGVMLYEALLGRLPFSGSSAAVLDAKRRLDLPQPRDLADGIPADLNDLCRDLLNRDPARRPDATAVLARLDPRRAASVAVGAARPLPQFIGRARELAELDSAFDAACQGRAVIACVQGAPGIGKSALVRRFLDAVRERRAEAVVLAGRCYEREAVPYKALDSLVDALSLYLVGLSPSQVDAVLPRDVSALARVFPVLRRVDAVAYARQRAADIPDAQEVRRRAFQAFRELIGRIADRQPLLLFIDDVHWGDADSAALLTEMLRPADRPALLLLATYRSREALASPIVDALQATAATSAVDLRDLRLGELTAGESQQLARALLQTRELSPQSSRAEALARESAGNPFFLHELVQDVQAADAPVAASADHDAGDVTLERVIHRRIGRLPSTARRLVEALAVFGRPVDVMLAGRAADVEAQALDALVMLRGASLVRTHTTSDGHQVELYHDRIRETLLSRLAPDVLSAIHGRFARALEATGNPDPEALALHFRAAGDDALAARYAEQAAGRAVEALAFDRAAALYRDALDLLPAQAPARHRLAVSLGDALARAGRGRDAAQVFLAAAPGAEPTEALELTRRAAEQFLRAGYIDDGFVAIRAVLRAMGLKLAPTARRVLAGLILRRLWIRVRGLRFRKRDASAVPPFELMRIDACWSLSMGLGIVDTVRGADFQARHLLLALRAGEPYRVARAVAMEAGYSSALGETSRRRTERLFSLAERLAEESRHPHAVALVSVARGLAGCMLGDWRAARERCERAEALLREQCTGVAWELSIAHLYSLFALSYLGEMRELVARYPTYVSEARDRDDVNAATNIRTRIAYLGWLAAGDPDGAEREVRQGIAHWSQSGFHAQHYFEMGSLTEVWLYRGNGAAAWQWLSNRWPHFRGSLLWRVERIDTEATFFRARAALAASLDPALEAGDRAGLRRIAERCAAKLAAKPSPVAKALGAIAAAGVAAGPEPGGRVITALAHAERLLIACDMRLHAAVVRRRRGELLSAPEGTCIVDEADAWMRGEGLREPERWTALIAPGGYHLRPEAALT